MTVRPRPQEQAVYVEDLWRPRGYKGFELSQKRRTTIQFSSGRGRATASLQGTSRKVRNACRQVRARSHLKFGVNASQLSHIPPCACMLTRSSWPTIRRPFSRILRKPSMLTSASASLNSIPYPVPLKQFKPTHV